MTTSTSEVKAERLAKLREDEALLHRDMLELAVRLRTSAVGVELIQACEIEQRIHRYVERFGDSDRLDRGGAAGAEGLELRGWLRGRQEGPAPGHREAEQLAREAKALREAEQLAREAKALRERWLRALRWAQLRLRADLAL